MKNERKQSGPNSSAPNERENAGVPGGNAQLDPAEQSHRRDMEGDERNGPEGSFRGSLPPGTPANTERARPAQVPGKDDAERIASSDDGSKTRGGTSGKPI